MSCNRDTAGAADQAGAAGRGEGTPPGTCTRGVARHIRWAAVRGDRGRTQVPAAQMV